MLVITASDLRNKWDIDLNILSPVMQVKSSAKCTAEAKHIWNIGELISAGVQVLHAIINSKR